MGWMTLILNHEKNSTRASYLSKHHTFGRLHGSSMSHCDRRKTSSNPINSIKELPPQVAAKVGPTGAPTGQSQTAIGTVTVYFSVTDINHL